MIKFNQNDTDPRKKAKNYFENYFFSSLWIVLFLE